MKIIPTSLASAAVAAALSLAAVAPAAFADGSRAPLQDTFVRDTQPDSAFGSDANIIVGGNREGCMMFDVSGLAGVTSAKVRFYVTQCGTASGIVWPLYFRVMRNDRWNETTLTWNSLPDEFRVGPSPVLATNDVSLAGYVEIPAGSADTWQEVDVTEAVRAAAPRGRLALHIYTSWDGTSGDTTPLAFASSNYTADESLRPTLVFEGAADTSASTLTIIASADTHVSRWAADTNYGSANDAAMVDKDAREAFIKFDLSNVNADAVDSAVFLLHTYPTTSGDHAYTSNDGIQFELTGKTDWDEMAMTWNNAQTQTGTAVGRSWEAETPSNAVRGPSSAADKTYTVDLTKLVNHVLAAGGDTLSLHIWRDPSDSKRYFFICPREYANEAQRPRLLITPKVDAALATRTPVQETFVGNGNAANTAYFPWMLGRNPVWDYLQVGCSETTVQYGLMLFDPAGLEDADYVRFRVKSRNTISANAGALRVASWTTDRWNATNLTWNTTGPWFPQPASVADGTALDGEIATVKLAQNKSGAYFEVDVTAAARAAAASGRMLTLGLFSNGNWPEFYKGASSYPAVLLFPDPDATFGARVTATLDESGETPALRLAWSPVPSGNGEYTVERSGDSGATWKMVASGLSEATCLDASAEPWTEYTYRITGYDADDGSSSVIVKAVTLNAVKTLFACADTYVQNGSNATAAKGTEASLVMKYDARNNSGGVRESFFRFDLSEAPTRFLSATLKLDPTGAAGAGTGDENVSLLKYEDFEWTDAAAPSWNTVFFNGYSTPRAFADNSDSARKAKETSLGAWLVSENGAIQPGVPLAFDVTEAIRSALAAGESHITLHAAAYDPQGNWNFGFVPRERSQGVSLAPRIEFELKNWVQYPFMMVVR